MSDNFKKKHYVWAVYNACRLIFGAFLVPIFGFEKAFYVFLTYSLFSAICIFVFGVFPAERPINGKQQFIDDYFSEEDNHGDETDKFDEIMGIKEKEKSFDEFIAARKKE